MRRRNGAVTQKRHMQMLAPIRLRPQTTTVNGVICGSAGNPTFEKLDHGCGSASDFHRLSLQNAKSVGIAANKVKIPARSEKVA